MSHRAAGEDGDVVRRRELQQGPIPWTPLHGLPGAPELHPPGGQRGVRRRQRRLDEDLKEDVYSELFKTQADRRRMNTLYNLIHRAAARYTKEQALAHINKLPDVLEAIIAKNGARTKF